MSSCEPRRCSAYSEDLRWRMVYQREALRFTYVQIGKNLCVDTTTVWQTVDLFKRTGTVNKKVYDLSNIPKKLTDMVQLILLQLILTRPCIYLCEIQAEVKMVTGLDLASSTICRFFHAQGFTRQKMQIIAKQRQKVTSNFR